MTFKKTTTTHIAEPIIQVAILGLLLVWCFRIISPFIQPVAWGIIIAVATYPIYRLIANKLGKREKLAAPIFTVFMLALLITPTYEITMSITNTATELKQQWEAGTLKVSPPAAKVKEWPIVGEKLYGVWLSASENLESTLIKHKDSVATIAKASFATITGAGFSVLQFILSIIIAGILLGNANACTKLANALAFKLAGQTGKDFAKQAGDTISSVAKGVLGVAIIQSILAAIGLLLIGIPGAGIWAVLVLILAIMQLPPIIILGPIAFYAFSAFDSTAATLFLIWSVFVSISDSFLKPMLLGRGLSTPMIVILLGAIGGMMLSGIIGLFVGAVVLSLAYELFITWLYGKSSEQIATEQLNPAQQPASPSASSGEEQ